MLKKLDLINELVNEIVSNTIDNLLEDKALLTFVLSMDIEEHLIKDADTVKGIAYNKMWEMLGGDVG